HVFTELHGRHGLYSVAVVGCGDGDSVNTLVFLVQHLAVVLVVLCFRKGLHGIGGAAVVNIAKKTDLRFSTLRKVRNVALAFATHTDTCNVYGIAWRAISVS